jgi:hypothetical protein
MKIRNAANVPSYWDEGNRTKFRWYRKGKWKKILRNRWIKKILKNNEE